MKPQPIIVNDQKVKCQSRACRRLARHTHHIQPRCEGGPDTPDNLMHLCTRCHVAHHSAAGDFRLWGAIGGTITQTIHRTYLQNLKQFREKAHLREQVLQEQHFVSV
jgi:hypothetical protein